jgi:hypothetical protein
MPEQHPDITALLPAYQNGSLDDVVAGQVRHHLLSCPDCQQELADWEAIQRVTQHVYAAMPLPSLQLMETVWAKLDQAIEEVEVVQHSQRKSLARVFEHYWRLFRAQIPLLHKSIWIASVLICLLGLITTLLIVPHTATQKHFASSLLILFIVVVGASGSAFIYGSEADPGFELTLATPTSIRILMLSRLLIVLGYNFLLAVISSAVFALIYGGSLGGFIQLWFGPLLFFSSLCLMISLCAGSTIALLVTSILEVLQTFPNRLISHLLPVPLPALDLGTTSPTMLGAALVLIAIAIYIVPRQPRPVSLP